MTKCLVTGVAGFIGSRLASTLLDRGDDVIGVDALTDYYDVRLKEENISRLKARARFEFLPGYIEEMNGLVSLLDDVTFVFHLAGQPGVRSSWGSEFQLYSRANVEATQYVLESAVQAAGVQRLIYASSSSVYGDSESFPTSELDLPAPMSPYGVTKLAGEHLCRLYGWNFGLSTTSLRFFTVYGPGQRPDMAFARFCDSILNSGKISINGTGEQIRDFTYVDDVIAACIIAADVETGPASVFNVAGGTSISVNEVVRLLQEISGVSLEVVHESAVRGDVLRTGGSTQRIRNELKWEPEVDIRTGLERQFEWASRRV